MNALVYVDIDQGIHKGKMEVAQNEKRKKLLGFSFYINIGNFEAFLWNLNLSTNRLFWRCVYWQLVFTFSIINVEAFDFSKKWSSHCFEF